MAPSPAEATKKLLSTLWERNLPILRERVEELERAARSVASRSFTAEDRASAESTAHKLAGSMGMFGYPRATDIARKLETIFGTKAGELNASEISDLVVQLRNQTRL